jgi:hypothetical protein
MSLAYTPDRLRLPDSLQGQMHQFRRRVWTIKIVEAVAAAAFGILIAYLFLFGLDRIFDTPGWLRISLFVIAALACANIPLALHRWVWRQRRLEQLARLLARKHPRVGDQLLGIIELARNEFEQARSRTLCEAAIREVARDAERRDFGDAIPNPRHRLWAWLAAVPLTAAVAVFVLYPAAAANAWQRFLAPWGNAPRYTFTSLEQLPSRIVVAHGEPFSLDLQLADKTVWRPAQAVGQLGAQAPVVAPLSDGRYDFEFPPQLDPGTLNFKIGDAFETSHIEPALRPELTSIVADVQLPKYLGLPAPRTKDVRGGAVSLVKGSQATFTATASRELSSAQVDASPQTPRGAKVASPPTLIASSRKMEFVWKDKLGLAGKEPFSLAITASEDEAPSLTCEDLPRQKVVLDTEQLAFKVRAQDDFGIKQVGLDWKGIEDDAKGGERILAAGAHDRDSLELAGTFSARSLGIEPQPVNVRLFVEDYLPGRGRVYSQTYTFYVLTAEQHAIWITQQLSKWHRQSLLVRDREMQLYETNKQLRALTAEELDRPENRRRIENQAMAERANGRQLTGLTAAGEDLIKQAMRNPEFGIAPLEKWAEMLQILKDIAGNRMPSVSDLLREAAQAPSLAQAGNPSATPAQNGEPKNSDAKSSDSKNAASKSSQAKGAQAKSSPSQSQENNNKSMMAGQNRANAQGGASQPKADAKKPPSAVPQIADGESSQQPPDEKAAQGEPSKSPPKNPVLRLPVTTLVGGGASSKKPPESPAEEKVDEALTQQRDLLAEFEKIADELNRVLANLEGSTLVKRLKAASRVQYKIGGRIDGQVSAVFGVPGYQVGKEPAKVMDELSNEEANASHDVSDIMDDMSAYFERRQFMRFKTVLDEMRQLDVVGSLRQIGDDLPKENGMSVAQCEYWSDTLDRWAEDLVEAGKSGQCKAKSKSSLPPALVLEALQILEGEVNLREDTRVAEQARPALASDGYLVEALKLSTTQKTLNKRVDKLGEAIRDLPDSETEFGYEMALMAKVSEVMQEATQILSTPETGSTAIAAETEVIELLLQSKRINPKGGGGGGGATPGGGGHGKTLDSALALFGGGTNEKEVREDRAIPHVGGESGVSLPEEFRAGLDEYFNRLERHSGGR